MRDGAEGLPAGELAVEIYTPSFLGARRCIPDKLVAALGFRLHREPQWDGRGEAAREAKKLGRIASLQLELDLMHGSLALCRLDGAAIDGNLDIGPAAYDMIDASFDAGLEQRPQALAHAVFQQRFERRAGSEFEIRPRAADLPLPFRAIEQLCHAAHALHGLHIAFASVTHAQAKTRLVQGKGVRVVVDRDQGLPDEPYSGKQRMRFDSGKIGWIEFKFKLELSWLTFGLITVRHNRNSYAPSQVSQKALTLSCLKKLNLAGKVSWNCHKMTPTGEGRRLFEVVGFGRVKVGGEGAGGSPEG